MKSFAPLFLLILVCGCTSTLTKAGLDAKAMEHAGSASPDQTYYAGSDNRYDYFVIRSGTGGPTHLYRVRRSEGAATNRFITTKDETSWRGYPTPSTVRTNDQVIVPK